jgi:site-specific recombinase XerD
VYHLKKKHKIITRYTLLSHAFVKPLREYAVANKPKRYFFEGQKGGKYSNTSAQKVLKNALVKAKTQKNITLHSLRHSFANHLL